ncbi:hypothetical protein CK203_026628 [Vitis vinifera]|uniref:Uncharacterized protein n=1 Tax=Vitis vinifera TaxID=29760 RepID=A0A438IU30_VITVI|nr:hypothetical protein CK203_026628 [Vitis vinifera]
MESKKGVSSWVRMGLASVGFSWKGGLFPAIRVVDSEMKRYSICIPKGRGDKGGWLAMVEALRKLDNSFDKKEQQQEERVLGRSFADTGGLGKFGLGNGKVLGVERQDGFGKLGKRTALLELSSWKKQGGSSSLVSQSRYGSRCAEKSGDVCGGFLDIDPQTESMEELQWARILVKSDGEISLFAGDRG